MKIHEDRWKYVFFTLLTVVILLIMGIYVAIQYYFPPADEVHFDTHIDNNSKEEQLYFTIETNKEQLNQYLASYVDGDYKVELNDRYAIFQTTIPIFSVDVLTQIDMIPVYLII